MKLFLIMLAVLNAHGEVIYDSQLAPLVERFKASMVEYWPVTEPPLPKEVWEGLVIRIDGAVHPNADAECSHEKDGSRVITLDSVEWLKNDSDRREAVMFHELGHCVLGLEHDNRECKYGPCSIMNHSAPSGSDYKEHKSEYLNELFFKGAINVRNSSRQ